MSEPLESFMNAVQLGWFTVLHVVALKICNKQTPISVPLRTQFEVENYTKMPNT